MQESAQEQPGEVEQLVDTKRRMAYAEIAEIIGGEVTAERVAGVINLLNSGHIVHGIKTRAGGENVNQQGVLRKTPEGGRISCWTSGLNVFFNSMNGGDMKTFDTTFFHYAHAGDSMIIAITNTELLAGLGVEVQFVKDAYASLTVELPRDKMALLRVINPPENSESIERVQALERAMFQLLERVLTGGYQGGELIELDLSTSEVSRQVVS